MEKLKKGKAIVYPPRIASGAHVYAYELATAAVDKTYVGGPGRPFTPLQTAHQNAAYNVAIATAAGAAGGAGGGWPGALGTGSIALVASGTNQCWTSCHQYSPTKQP